MDAPPPQSSRKHHFNTDGPIALMIGPRSIKGFHFTAISQSNTVCKGWWRGWCVCTIAWVRPWRRVKCYRHGATELD